MNSVRSMHGIGDGLAALWRGLVGGRGLSRGAAWGLMIVGALLAFEIFNFSTTEFALHDVLGDLAFAGLRWSTVLAIAFCAMDFAGIARMFTPESGRDEPAEVWYLFGAWLLAASFNATLTWWGVSVAIAKQASSVGTSVVANDTLTQVVPVFVAAMVWLIRVLIIGTFSVAGDRLFSTATSSAAGQRSFGPSGARPQVSSAAPRAASAASRPVAASFRSAPKPSSAAPYDRLEPTYQNLSLDAASPETGREHRIQ
ncbi:MAG: hypothetical protein V1755_07205 [Chloroflexota bacterium]